MARKLTEAQIEKAKARREKLQALWKKVAAMSDEERKSFAEQNPLVMRCEGGCLSANNSILLSFQRQDVTVVGGFAQWIKQGRVVQKGEQALGIWIPMGKKENDDGEEEPAYYKFGNVFDITQTEELEAK